MAKRNNDDEPKDENINNDADDTFGLPEVEYEPLKRDEPVEEPAPVEEPVYETPVETESPVASDDSQEKYEPEQQIEQYEEDHEENTFQSPYAYREEKPAVWPKVVLILLLIFVAGAALFYFAYYKPNKDRELAATIQADKQRKAEIAARKLREKELQEQQAREAEQRRADSLANIPKTGTFERLEARTGQYYVVVASAVDDDLLTDFAGKLTKQGKQVRLIPPFGKDGKFYRLAIDAKGSYAEAQAAADGMKGGEFGDQLWVVRY